MNPRKAWGAVKAARDQANSEPWVDFQRHAAFLRPGLWVSHVSEGNVWRHAEAALPSAISGPGGKVGQGCAHGFVWSSRWEWAKKTVLCLAIRLATLRRRMQPHRVILAPAQPSRGNASVVLRAWPGANRAEIIALDLADRRATRIASPGTYDQEYQDVRERFQRYFPGPSYSISEDEAIVVEEWSSGQVLSGYPLQRKRATGIDVLGAYAALVENEAVSGRMTPWDSLPDLIYSISAPAAMKDSLADPRVRRLLESNQLVPTQGDLAPANILLQAQSLSWTVIDYDGAGWMPVWWDLFSLGTEILESNRASCPETDLALSRAFTRILYAVDPTAVGLHYRHGATFRALGSAWRRIAEPDYLSVHSAFTPEPEAFEEALQRAFH